VRSDTAISYACTVVGMYILRKVATHNVITIINLIHILCNYIIIRGAVYMNILNDM